MKLCANFENKNSKQEKKIKSLKEELEKKNSVVRELEFLCQEKSKENE